MYDPPTAIPPRNAEVLPVPMYEKVPSSTCEFDTRVTIGLKYAAACARTPTVNSPSNTAGHSLAHFVIQILQHQRPHTANSLTSSRKTPEQPFPRWGSAYCDEAQGYATGASRSGSRRRYSLWGQGIG